MRTYKAGIEKKIALLSMLVMIMMLAIGPAAAHAFDCASATQGSLTDSDSDGFTDYDECNGITLTDGTSFPGANSGQSRSVRLDPSTRDLFIILVPLPSGSLMTDASGNLITDPTATLANVGVTAHMLNAALKPVWAASDRTVAPTSETAQKAVMITENSDGTLKSGSSYAPFGDSHYGTPNNLDGATVWTQRIKNYVETVACPDDSKPCTDSVSGASGRAAVITTYIRNTISHEAGHVMKLTPTSNSRYNGNHYAPGSNTVMEQSIVYKTTKNSGAVTFTIPQAFASGDYTAATLR